MKLVNNSDNNLMHTIRNEETKVAKTYFLAVGQVLDVPKEIAEKWLKINGIEKKITEEDLEKAVEKVTKSKAGKSGSKTKK